MVWSNPGMVLPLRKNHSGMETVAKKMGAAGAPSCVRTIVVWKLKQITTKRNHSQ